MGNVLVFSRYGGGKRGSVDVGTGRPPRRGAATSQNYLATSEGSRYRR